MWRFVIEHKAIGPNGAEAIMGRSKSLAKLLDRLETTNEFNWFYRQGWRNARLQDNTVSSSGYTDTLREHLWSLYRLKHIDRNTYMRAIAYAS